MTASGSTISGDNELVEKSYARDPGRGPSLSPLGSQRDLRRQPDDPVVSSSILSIALQVLLSLVGALTLGIAGIGLMNIMLVAVQQRTREIGVEKALGARRHHILIQFLAEALAITGVGGVMRDRAGLRLSTRWSAGLRFTAPWPKTPRTPTSASSSRRPRSSSPRSFWPSPAWSAA